MSKIKVKVKVKAEMQQEKLLWMEHCTPGMKRRPPVILSNQICGDNLYRAEQRRAEQRPPQQGRRYARDIIIYTLTTKKVHGLGNKL